MKPNKTLFGAFVISVTLIIGACQQTELSDSAPTPSFPAPAAEFVADDSDLSARRTQLRSPAFSATATVRPVPAAMQSSATS